VIVNPKEHLIQQNTLQCIYAITNNKQLATGRIVAAAQIDPSYSPGGANVLPVYYIILQAHMNGITIVFLPFLPG